VKAAVDKCRSIIKKAETDLKNKTAATIVPNTISKAWTVYRPDKNKITPAAYEMFGKLTAVPEQFFGVKGEKMIADQTGAILLPGDIPFRP